MLTAVNSGEPPFFQNGADSIGTYCSSVQTAFKEVYRPAFDGFIPSISRIRPRHHQHSRNRSAQLLSLSIKGRAISISWERSFQCLAPLVQYRWYTHHRIHLIGIVSPPGSRYQGLKSSVISPFFTKCPIDILSQRNTVLRTIIPFISTCHCIPAS